MRNPIFNAFASARRPLVNRPAGDGAYIMACLRRYAATSANEVAHAARPSIVSGGGEAEIAELASEFGQEFRRLGDGRLWIEGIEQSALIGGVRHELRDPLRPMTAARRRPNGVRLKSALFPNNPGKEFKRQTVCRRCQFEYQAHRVRGGR